MAKLYQIKLSDKDAKLNPQTTTRKAEVDALVTCVSLAASKTEQRAEYFTACDLKEQVEEAFDTLPDTIDNLSEDDFKIINKGFGLSASMLQGGRPFHWTKLRALWEQLDKDTYSKQEMSKPE
jgi:hypothetical protein